jgi:DNA-binding CsgD family transcriptional regulator
MVRGLAVDGRLRATGPAHARRSLRVAEGRARVETGPRPALHGRDLALRALDRRLDALADGRGGVVLVQGPPGAGRTRVLDHAQERAERAGLRVRRGAGDPATRAMPLAPLLDALLRGPDPVLDARALRGIAALDDGRFWLVRELEERLERAALGAANVIALDDVQWADDLTLLALRTLPTRLSAHAVLWLLAVPSGDAAVPPAALLRADGAETLELAALDRAAVAALARDVLGAVPDDAVVDLACAVDRRPALLVALLRGLREEGLVRVADGRAELLGRRLPARLRDAVAARVAQLSEPAQEAVRTASALGRRCTPEQLAVLLGRTTPGLVAPLREALAAELLVEQGDALAFRHDLVREAVDAGLPASIRRALRRQTGGPEAPARWPDGWTACAGRLPDVRAAAERVLATVDALGPGAAGAAAAASHVLACVALRTGDRAALRAAAGTAAAMRTDASVTVRHRGAWLAALLADADGDTPRVLQLLDETLGVLATPALSTLQDPGELLVLLRLVLRTGHLGHAETVVREAERRAALAPGLALLATHARGLLERDPAALRASAGALADRLGPLARADVLEDVALAVATEDRDEAVAHLDTALALHDAAGATRDAARVRRHLRDLGERRRRPPASHPSTGWAGLTRSELAVVELVAEGATNRAAAQRLHLSPHTVSSHLRHAFEKLGVRSRVELAVLFAQRAS